MIAWRNSGDVIGERNSARLKDQQDQSHNSAHGSVLCCECEHEEEMIKSALSNPS